uniref:Uncharacterized protein n=1 Tax=Tanacetum cinerariifolium TaxID=118510 RepID=A0A699GY11_TANCI|nr:hypothetical protein [Tanacetum cinerariifolium]
MCLMRDSQCLDTDLKKKSESMADVCWFELESSKNINKASLAHFPSRHVFFGRRVVSSALWQKIRLMRSMAKCGRMVESENQSPRQPPQAHQETLMILCGSDKHEIVRILAEQLFMVVAMAKYGRMAMMILYYLRYVANYLTQARIMASQSHENVNAAMAGSGLSVSLSLPQTNIYTQPEHSRTIFTDDRDQDGEEEHERSGTDLAKNTKKGSKLDKNEHEIVKSAQKPDPKIFLCTSQKPKSLAKANFNLRE